MFGCVHCVGVVELQKKPRGHSRHDDMPGLVAKNPLSHGKHSVGVVEYVPGSQLVHMEEFFSAEYIPGGHMSQ